MLLILDKPAFLKGPKSFMLIEKSACNKPLTLDCQVSSNPGANITWYRRRLNKNLHILATRNEHDHSVFNRIDYTKLKSIGINDFYYDEMIGTGPTYTIASFNCANKLANLRNKTAHNLARSRAATAQVKNSIENDSIDPSEVKEDQTEAKATSERSKTNFLNDLPEDYEDNYNDDYIQSSLAEYDDEGGYDDDEDEHMSELVEYQQEKSLNELDDFGIYVCEASNRLAMPPESFQYDQGNAERRYIKINPSGPPLTHALSTPGGASNMNELIATIMEPSKDIELKDSIEIATSIGLSVSITCLIEPLPDVHTIVWLRDNGKVIANSKYSIYETPLGQNTNVESVELNKKKLKNFRVKYENLTIYENKPQEGDETLEAATISSFFNEANWGVKTANSDVGLMRSVLYIKKVRVQDFGVYKCKSSNSFGSRTVSILVRETTLLGKLKNNFFLGFKFL